MNFSALNVSFTPLSFCAENGGRGFNRMFRRENCVLVVGEENILHQGFFYLIEREGLMCSKKTIFAENMLQLNQRQPAFNQGHYALSFICISRKDFFAEWVSLLVKVTFDSNGSVLIFTEKCELLTPQRKRIIERIIDVEFILHPGLPTAYISHIIQLKMESNANFKMKCNLSAREVIILESFISGVSAARQATQLGISLKTLCQHRKNCANKLGLSNLKELLFM